MQHIRRYPVTRFFVVPRTLLALFSAARLRFVWPRAGSLGAGGDPRTYNAPTDESGDWSRTGVQRRHCPDFGFPPHFIVHARWLVRPYGSGQGVAAFRPSLTTSSKLPKVGTPTSAPVGVSLRLFLVRRVGRWAYSVDVTGSVLP